MQLTPFTSVARRFLKSRGYDIKLCESEQEAREEIASIDATNSWPCYFFPSDTTGEKPFEEFYTEKEVIDWRKYNAIGVIKNTHTKDGGELDLFEQRLVELRSKTYWTREHLIALVKSTLPEFEHDERNKNLEQRM